MNRSSRILNGEGKRSCVKVSRKTVNSIIAQRTGIKEEIVGMIIEEYGLYLMEAVFINRQSVSVFGIATMFIKDNGKATRRGLHILKRLRLKLTPQSKARIIMNKLNEQVEQGIEIPKDYKKYIQDLLVKYKEQGY